MNRLLFSIIITLCSLTAQSQTFLDSLRKDEPGKGSVSVTQSPEIDNLVNGTGQDHSGSTAKEGAGHTRQSSTTQQHHEDGKHDSASSESHTHEGTS